MNAIKFTNAETGEVTEQVVNDDLNVGDRFRLIGRTMEFRVAVKKMILGICPSVVGVSICGKFKTGARIADTLQVV